MDKLIITRWNNRILTALFSEKEILELGLEEKSSVLGNIYIGKINRVVKNLNSAFVEFGEGQTGYYSLEDNPVSLPAQQNKMAVIPSGELKGGDEIIVQVAKEAIKTKDPVLTANLNFPGKFAVLTSGKKSINFSAKIHDKAWKDQLRPRLEELLQNSSGIIVRTNGYRQEEEILTETKDLLKAYKGVLEAANYRTCGSVLYQAEPEYLNSLRSSHAGSLAEILTDQEDVYQKIKGYLGRHQPEDLEKLRYYQDPLLSLASLYSLKTVMDQACQKRVWLKSGGYLVIEPTEAMVVIDVNTGKYSGKKNQADTIRMINLEAAREICRQLRLRNLSGIIMVDFIDMKEESDKALLIEHLRSYAALDPVKTTVVDMTQLNLVELTRKKGKKPLWEQLNLVKENKA
ncbi:ribonuclease E/G [Clostridiaceae bacterium]|nr:ribonuclease E/G [Clostridiaceae bacterium]RKI13131.1 ribonuclease E/G [bacterium 1XD21-70]